MQGTRVWSLVWHAVGQLSPCTTPIEPAPWSLYSATGDETTVRSQHTATRVKSCLTLSDPMDCSPPGSSIQRSFQARVLEWGAIAFSEECSNYHTIALISYASEVMLKILQARLQQYVNHELPDVQAGFRKGRGTRDQIANIPWIMEKAREFQKNIYFCFLDYAKAFDCVDHNKLWRILKEMGIPDHLPNRKRSTSRLYIVTLLI